MSGTPTEMIKHSFCCGDCSHASASTATAGVSSSLHGMRVGDDVTAAGVASLDSLTEEEPLQRYGPLAGRTN